MARIARLKVKGEPAVYHVISRTTLEGFVLGDVGKDHLPGKEVKRRQLGAREESSELMRIRILLLKVTESCRQQCREL